MSGREQTVRLHAARDQPIPDLGSGKELFAYRLRGPLFCSQPVCFRLIEVRCLGFSK